ncbi:type I restriction endonuclease [Propionibacterium freudenreichii]|uniref:type I restriction endonuclease n=1 Tax=Propionibacterium freudenreichii TaxID=1744 RepID=UPI000BC2FCB4|nr:type I restriction endonuclease [Propionibacterium freudenreichii]SBM43958.1 Prophage Lp2 protein 6 [Propionibacterium freudenreichii]
MDFEDALEDIASRIGDYGNTLDTEEATKNAIIMPFMSKVLGYDVFDPTQVTPEFTTDVGTKKGEKIDYAIRRNGEVQVLIECKRIDEPLSLNNASQLFRYFHVSSARIGVLTNGKTWEFFTDLDEPNKMDEKPFLLLDLTNIDPYILPELKKLTRESFDLDSVLTAAEELKYVSSIKKTLAALFEEPDDDFLRLIVAHVYEGSITARVRDFFHPLVGKATKQFLNDRVNARLKSALQDQAPAVGVVASSTDASPEETAPQSETTNQEKPGVITTEEELEGSQIVRAVAASEINWDRIFYRDAKSYFGILVDDNNRKPICRLHLDHKAKSIGLLDEDKTETRLPIEQIQDIYNYADEIREAARRYV